MKSLNTGMIIQGSPKDAILDIDSLELFIPLYLGKVGRQRREAGLIL